MASDYSGIVQLLEDLRQKALVTSKYYQGVDRETFDRKDWPRDAEVELIEHLVVTWATKVTGQNDISESVWKRCRPFAHMFAAPWLGSGKRPDESWNDAQKRYEYGEAKFHEGIALWVDHTLDYLKYLQAMDTDKSTPASVSSILFLAANPSEFTRLRLDIELREIREELERAKLRDRFKLDSRGAIRPKDFTRAMLDLAPSFVHFSGHGSESGAICVEDDRGGTVELDPDAVADLFQVTGTHVACVLLNACFSERQAHAIARHVPHVIGMTKAIGDNAAICFATGFYRAIGAGRSVPDAFKLGLTELRMYSIPEFLTPILIHAAPNTN